MTKRQDTKQTLIRLREELRELWAVVEPALFLRSGKAPEVAHGAIQVAQSIQLVNSVLADSPYPTWIEGIDTVPRLAALVKAADSLGAEGSRPVAMTVRARLASTPCPEATVALQFRARVRELNAVRDNRIWQDPPIRVSQGIQAFLSLPRPDTLVITNAGTGELVEAFLKVYPDGGGLWATDASQMAALFLSRMFPECDPKGWDPTHNGCNPVDPADMAVAILPTTGRLARIYAERTLQMVKPGGTLVCVSEDGIDLPDLTLLDTTTNANNIFQIFRNDVRP